MLVRDDDARRRSRRPSRAIRCGPRRGRASNQRKLSSGCGAAGRPARRRCSRRRVRSSRRRRRSACAALARRASSAPAVTGMRKRRGEEAAASERRLDFEISDRHEYSRYKLKGILSILNSDRKKPSRLWSSWTTAGPGREVGPARDVARSSRDSVHQLLLPLVRSGWVAAGRGRNGGYRRDARRARGDGPRGRLALRAGRGASPAPRTPRAAVPSATSTSRPSDATGMSLLRHGR